MISDFFNLIKQNPLAVLGGPVTGLAASLKGVFGEHTKYNLMSDVSSLADSLGGVGTGDSILNQYTKAGPTGEQQWLANREDTAYQRASEDMKAAGLNPAMMYGSGQASSSSVGQSGSPAVSLSDMLELAALPAKIAEINSVAELNKSNARKAEADANAQEMNLPFITRLNELRVEGAELSNRLTSSQISRVYREIYKMEAEVDEIHAKEMLEKAEAQQITELLPLAKEFKIAETQQAKAQAYLMSVQAAYQNKLMSSGYLDALIDEAKASAQSMQAKADIDQIFADIRAGRYGNDGKWFNVLGSKLLAGFANTLDLIPVRVGSVISQSNSTSQVIK